MRLHRYATDAARSWWLPFEAEQWPLDVVDPIEAQMQHFEAVIRGDALPAVTVEDGLRNLEVTEAILQAASNGQRVTLRGYAPKL